MRIYIYMYGSCSGLRYVRVRDEGGKGVKVLQIRIRTHTRAHTNYYHYSYYTSIDPKGQ